MRLFAAAIVLAFFSSISMTVQTARSQALDLVLPTDNDALFSGDGAAFYQYVERDYKGEKSTPWEGGQYGFVRDPIGRHSVPDSVRFHEGIDIRPLRRDANGEPLSIVLAGPDRSARECVQPEGYSNYGRYIVIE